MGCSTKTEAALNNTVCQTDGNDLGFFERYLTVWVAICMVLGILLGKIAPQFATYLDSMTLDVGGAPVVSIPIAICLFFMMYPIMVKIDFLEVLKAGRNIKPVFLTLFINWAIKPFTMYAIAYIFLGVILKSLIGVEATDLIRLPFGLDLAEGATYGAGTVVIENGIRMLEVSLMAKLSSGLHSAWDSSMHCYGARMGLPR